MRHLLIAGLVAFAVCPETLGGGARAADDAIVSATANASFEYPLHVGVPALNGEVRLRNGSTDAARILRLGPQLVRSTDQYARPAQWSQFDGGLKAAAPVGGQVEVKPGEEAVLRLAATLDRPGVYETWVDAYRAGAAAVEQRIRVVVTRELEPVPSEFIVAPPAVRQVWPWNGLGEDRILVRLRDAGTKPVEFDRPGVLGVTDVSGDQALTEGSETFPAFDAGCPSPLEAGQECALKLSLPAGLGAGKYAIDVGVGGPGGGRSSRSVLVAVRRTWWLAFLVTMAGAAGGWFVQFWRATGRRAVDGLIAIGDLKEAVRKIHDGDRDRLLDVLLDPLSTGLDGASARCRQGTDVTAEIDDLRDRVDRVRAAAAVVRAMVSQSKEIRRVLEPLYLSYVERVGTPNLDDAGRTAYETERKSIRQNLSDAAAWQRSLGAALAQRDLVSALSDLKLPPDVGKPLADAGTALAAAVDEAAKPIQADADAQALSKRSAALDKAAAVGKLATDAAWPAVLPALGDEVEAVEADPGGKEDAAKARARALLRSPCPADPLARRGFVENVRRTLRGRGNALEGMMSMAAAPQSAIDVPAVVILGDVDARPARLRKLRRWNEVATNVLVLVGIGLTGVVAISGNEIWGTWPDLFGMLLAGLASRVVLGELTSVIPQPVPH